MSFFEQLGEAFGEAIGEAIVEEMGLQVEEEQEEDATKYYEEHHEEAEHYEEGHHLGEEAPQHQEYHAKAEESNALITSKGDVIGTLIAQGLSLDEQEELTLSPEFIIKLTVFMTGSGAEEVKDKDSNVVTVFNLDALSEDERYQGSLKFYKTVRALMVKLNESISDLGDLLDRFLSAITIEKIARFLKDVEVDPLAERNFQNDPNLRYYLNMAQAAYQKTPDHLQEFLSKFDNTFQVKRAEIGDKTYNQLPCHFFGYSPKEDAIVVSIRGSASLSDWFGNACMGTVFDEDLQLTCHSGYAKASKDLWEYLKPKVLELQGSSITIDTKVKKNLTAEVVTTTTIAPGKERKEVKKGYLVKRSTNATFARWSSRRMFTLYSDYTVECHKDGSSFPIVIDLKGYTMEVNPPQSKFPSNLKHNFTLNPPNKNGRKWYMAADSEEEKNGWAAAFQTLAEVKEDKEIVVENVTVMEEEKIITTKTIPKKLRICGHSLGGAVSALLTRRAKKELGDDWDIHGYLYAPACAHEYLPPASQPLLTTVVHGNDLVPRLSLPTLINFAQELIDYASAPNEEESSLGDLIGEIASSVSRVMNEEPTVFLPGQCFTPGDVVYYLHYSDGNVLVNYKEPTFFHRIVFAAPSMLTNHFLANFVKAFDLFEAQHKY